MKIRYYILLMFCISVNSQVVRHQVPLEGNNIRTYIWNTGVFNQDMRTNNTPGCEWPKGSGKFVCFSAGLCIGAYINGELKVANASYNGEYEPGYSINSQHFVDTRFRFYKIKKGDSYINNPDWLNWGLMVPFGAPYSDINNNGIYEYYIDIPGFKGAKETVFICLSDGNPLNHTPSEGFGGGTSPVFATVGITAWCFDTLLYKDMQFISWVIKNGNAQQWDSCIFSIVTDPDLGYSSDDYIGCDSVRELGYCFNADNNDEDGSGRSYGLNPPAWGCVFLNCSNNINMSAFAHIGRNSSSPICEREPSHGLHSYRYIKGVKLDETPWVNIVDNTITKLCFSGDPETNWGWTMYNGKIENCNGQLTGPNVIPFPPGERRFLMSTQPPNQRLNPGESFTVLAAQMVARGSNHKNSVTLLKQLSDSAKALCQNGFVIGISQIVNEIPTEFNLYQNYPNPFNPATKIKFSIPKSQFVTLKIYDALGREVSTLVNDKVAAGVYSVDWDASSYPSGVYFYRLQTDDFSETRKMMLVK